MSKQEKSINEEPVWFEDENHVLTLDDFTTMSDEDVHRMTNEFAKFRDIEPINMYWRVNGSIVDYPIGISSHTVDTMLTIIAIGGNMPKLLRDSNGIASVIVDVNTI